MTWSLVEAIATIDNANRRDPNRHNGRPRALVEGERATVWLRHLDDAPSIELELACRAHHLCRWEVDRSAYPTGRAGYLAWRRANKAHQASVAAAILRELGWPPERIERVSDLLHRQRRRTDPEMQLLEDVACLVFLEVQFAPMVERTEHGRMVTIVTKTIAKMSDPAIEAASTLMVTPAARRVVADATRAKTCDE